MTHGSLFSGIGGFDLAAQWMGWENVFHCEWNPFGQKILHHYWPNAIQYHDITKTDFTVHRGSIDILTGGFPCQDISYAKSWTTKNEYQTNGIDGKRSGLWFEFARAIKEIKPKYIVAENVAALTKQGLDIVLQTLADIGYDAEWSVMPASIFGAPHLRKRIWIVAYPISLGRIEESIFFSKIFSKKIPKTSQWEFSRAICTHNGKKNLPESFGIHDGIPRKLYDAERIQALGNAVVPQVVYEIFNVIGEYDNTWKTQSPRAYSINCLPV